MMEQLTVSERRALLLLPPASSMAAASDSAAPPLPGSVPPNVASPSDDNSGRTLGRTRAAAPAVGHDDEPAQHETHQQPQRQLSGNTPRSRAAAENNARPGPSGADDDGLLSGFLAIVRPWLDGIFQSPTGLPAWLDDGVEDWTAQDGPLQSLEGMVGHFKGHTSPPPRHL